MHFFSPVTILKYIIIFIYIPISVLGFIRIYRRRVIDREGRDRSEEPRILDEYHLTGLKIDERFLSAEILRSDNSSPR